MFSIFHNNQNNDYLYDMTFIFDRCLRSWAVETPDKYERDWKYVTYIFAKSKFPVTNGALVPPHQGSCEGKGIVSTAFARRRRIAMKRLIPMSTI